MSTIDKVIRDLQFRKINSADYRIIESLTIDELVAFVKTMGTMDEIAINTIKEDFDGICDEYAKQLKVLFADKILIEVVHDFYRKKKNNPDSSNNNNNNNRRPTPRELGEQLAKEEEDERRNNKPNPKPKEELKKKEKVDFSPIKFK